MLYIPRIANYSEILTEKGVDFVVIFFFVWWGGRSLNLQKKNCIQEKP